MKYGRNKANPCLYFFRWTVKGLVLWISWVEDCLVAGKEDDALEAKASVMELFDWVVSHVDVGELKEYVGCKFDYGQANGTMKLTQPVMIQSFKDKFDLPEGKTHQILQQFLEL